MAAAEQITGELAELVSTLEQEVAAEKRRATPSEVRSLRLFPVLFYPAGFR